MSNLDVAYSRFPLFFQDQLIIGETFRKHPVVVASEFDLGDAVNRIRLPKYNWLARMLGVSPAAVDPLESYTDIPLRILSTLQSTDAYALAKEGNKSAKELLRKELVKLCTSMRSGLVQGEVFVKEIA